MNSDQLKISYRIIEKLEYKHRVKVDEVWECFLNRDRDFLEDTRLDHRTNPPTLWFIAETHKGRKLKVVFIELINGFL